MRRLLAVVTPTETSVQLLEEAGRAASGTDTEVVVLALVLKDSEYATVDAMREWDGFDDASGGESADTAQRFAAFLGEQVLDPLGVDYLPVGDRIETTRPSRKIIDAADNHGCDHVYVANRSRSPTGKALFGDTAQSVILNFDGFVTVRTA